MQARLHEHGARSGLRVDHALHEQQTEDQCRLAVHTDACCGFTCHIAAIS